MREEGYDPRGDLAENLCKAGIDEQKAFFIAIDAGIGVVDRRYLKEMGLKGVQLKLAEDFVKEFYWETDNYDDDE